MNDENTWMPFVCGFILGAVLLGFLTMTVYRGMAIDRGYGYYHPRTGAFTWKTNLVERVEFNK